MTSKERFAAACSLQAPDRVPVDYQAKPDLDAALRARFGIGSERELLEELGCDLYYLSGRDISQNETCLPIYRGPELRIEKEKRLCPFGILWRRGAGAGKFGVDEVIAGPLEKASSPGEVLRHPWPKAQWFDMDPLAEECENFADKVIVGGFWSGILGDSARLHGFQNFLMNMALNPPLIKSLVDRMTDFYLELNDRCFSALKGRLQVFYFGNDYGTQQGLLFSRALWQDLFLENTRRLTALARGYGLKVMAHSCGAVFELLDLFVEAGIDILDPVQTTAAGMEPRLLKERFGGRLVFHGAIDTQEVLPRGSAEEVRRHVRETIGVLGRGGGYILAPCNSLQSDTPLKNIEAMYRAAREA